MTLARLDSDACTSQLGVAGAATLGEHGEHLWPTMGRVSVGDGPGGGSVRGK